MNSVEVFHASNSLQSHYLNLYKVEEYYLNLLLAMIHHHMLCLYLDLSYLDKFQYGNYNTLILFLCPRSDMTHQHIDLFRGSYPYIQVDNVYNLLLSQVLIE